MRKKVFASIVFLVTMLFAVVGWAADWYCAATGTNGDGTEANPWVGFSNIVWGASGVQAGDTLHLYKGQTYSGNLHIAASGSAGSPITIIADAGNGNGKAIINGFTEYTSGWTQYSGNIYYRSFTLVGDSGREEEERCFVVYNSVNLTNNDGNYASLGTNQWDYDNDTGNFYINIGTDPNGKSVFVTFTNYGIDANSKSYLVIDNLLVKGCYMGLFFNDCDHITIKNVEATLNSYIQIRMLTSPYTTLINCVTHAERPDSSNGDITSVGISIYGGNHNQIINCESYNDRRGMDIYQSGAPNDQAYTVVHGGRYHDNTVDSFDADGITISGNGDGNPTGDARPVIEDVLAYRNADQGIDCVYGRNWIVKRCKSFGNSKSFGTGLGHGDGFKGGNFNTDANGYNSSNSFYYCLAYNNSHQGFYDDGQGNEYINCVAVGNGEYGFKLRFSDGDFTVKNCIAYDNGKGGIWWRTGDLGSGEIDYNCWSQGSGTCCAVVGSDDTLADNQYTVSELTDYQSRVSPQEAHTIFSDPLFTSNYHLSRNSPCIDAGIKLPIHDSNWRDLAGNRQRYGIAPDIGCYEYNSDLNARWGRRHRWMFGRWGVGRWKKNRWTPYE